MWPRVVFPNKLFDEVRLHFSEKELADLTFAIATINAWNRLAISARVTPGTCESPKKQEKQVA